MSSLRRSLLLLTAAGSLALTATSCSPSASARREAADKYFAAAEFDKAEIEYKNILQAGTMDPHAIAQLGLIYLQQGLTRQAVPYLLKARELQPENLEVREKVATLYLSSRKFAEAKTEAEYILSRQPTHENAPIFLIESSLGSPAEIESARQQLQELPDGAPVATAFGILELRQRNFSAAETQLKRALELNPKFVPAHSAMALVHLAQNDKSKAEESLKAAADFAPLRSGRALQYAQFKLQTGDKQAGREALEALSAKAPDYLPPLLALAEMAATEKRYDDSAALATKILARDAENPEATLLNGRLKLAQREPEQAIVELEKVLKINPQSIQALYFMGLAYGETGELDKAISRLTQAIKIAPMEDAILALARMNLRSGNFNAVVSDLEPFVKKHPMNRESRMTLADAYRAQGELDRALALYQSGEKDFSSDPRIPFQSGLVLLQQKKTAEARQVFTDLYQRAPAFLPALEQLVNLDLAEKQVDVAIQRIEAALERDPKSATAHLWLGRVYGIKGDAQRAEAEFLKSIELVPTTAAAHFQLAQLYVSSNQQQKALTSLKSILDQNPADASAWLMTGLIHNQLKDFAAARDAYEKLLAADPKSILGLNNLAYLYSEHFNDLEKAGDLAQKARDLLPNEPHTADTLGWVLYKRGQYPRALSLLEESAAELPGNADVLYHLGMSRYMMGLEEPAAQAFQRALDLNIEGAAATEIRRRLSILALAPTASGSDAITLLEKSLSDSPNDPVALSRLAAVHENAGNADKAVAAYQAAVKANPASPSPLMGLARLYATAKDTPKALEAAKAARKLAPDDPVITRALGSLAYKVGDNIWAASLLQEAARREPENAGLLFEAALAVYSTGEVESARELMTQALAPSPAAATSPFNSTLNAGLSKPDEAKRFLEMTAFSTKPDPAAQPKIDAALKANERDVPALMALGALQEKAAKSREARQTYEKVLATFSEFTPAKLRLAALFASEPDLDSRALAWAQQARTRHPNDAEAARALGILTYRTGGSDPTRVIGLLKQAITARPGDAESHYYLGLAQLANQAVSAGQQSLQKAIDLGLSPTLAADARKKLEPAK